MCWLAGKYISCTVFIYSGAEQALSTQYFHLLVNSSWHLLERETCALLHPLHFRHEHRSFLYLRNSLYSHVRALYPGVSAAVELQQMTRSSKVREQEEMERDIVHERPRKGAVKFFFSCHGPGLTIAGRSSAWWGEGERWQQAYRKT